MSVGVQFVAFIVLFQLFPGGFGGQESYYNYFKSGKVTAEEMEAELAKLSEAITKGIRPEEGDMEVAYFPSPDDDGMYERVDMSDVPAMEFHYIENKQPVTLIIGYSWLRNIFTKAPQRDDVEFYLFTNKTANGIQLYNYKDNRATVEEFWVKGGRVKILCHGFQSSHLNLFPQLMKDSYKKFDDVNVILVDWKGLASSFLYRKVAKGTTGVGRQVAILVQSLIKEGLTTLDQVHFIGHSLGAHVGGAFGFALQESKVGTVSRITGLDPAGPGFCDDDLPRLNKSDAHFVDVIHTDDSYICKGITGLIWLLNRSKGKWGSPSTTGHSDFYPNGGNGQPGCYGIIPGDSCSHSRAYYYMEESLNVTTVFKGCSCDDYDKYKAGHCNCSVKDSVVMGEYTPRRKDGGKYFLNTGREYPYSQVNG